MFGLIPGGSGMGEGIGTITITIILYVIVFFLFYHTMGLIAAIATVSACILFSAAVILIPMKLKRRKR